MSLTGKIVAGKYRVDRLLGAGRFASVYAATSTAEGSPVALKVYDAASAKRSGRGRRFAKRNELARKQLHPVVVPITDQGETDDGVPFLVMELLEGRTLAREIEEQGALPVARAVDIAVMLLEGLSAAHAEGIVHRNINPANVFLVREGFADPPVRLLDLGVAKDLVDYLAVSPDVIGSTSYLAPELLLSPTKAWTPGVDVFATGMVTFLMLTGRLPFDKADEELGLDPSDKTILLYNAINTLPGPSVFAPQVPQPIDEVVSRALTIKPERRYRNAGELLTALREASTRVGPRPLVSVASPATRPSPSPSSRPPPQPLQRSPLSKAPTPPPPPRCTSQQPPRVSNAAPGTTEEDGPTLISGTSDLLAGLLSSADPPGSGRDDSPARQGQLAQVPRGSDEDAQTLAWTSRQSPPSGGGPRGVSPANDNTLYIDDYIAQARHPKPEGDLTPTVLLPESPGSEPTKGSVPTAFLTSTTTPAVGPPPPDARRGKKGGTSQRRGSGSSSPCQREGWGRGLVAEKMPAADFLTSDGATRRVGSVDTEPTMMLDSGSESARPGAQVHLQQTIVVTSPKAARQGTTARAARSKATRDPWIWVVVGLCLALLILVVVAVVLL